MTGNMRQLLLPNSWKLKGRIFFRKDCAISTISHVSSAETESFSSQTVDRSVL